MTKSSVKRTPSLRLDRLLANLGYGSRREIHKMVSYGLIRYDHNIIHKADDHIELRDDLPKHLKINDHFLDPLPGMIVLLHKPLGMTCSHKEIGPLVYDLFPDRWRHRTPPLSTIGRLDKETSGLLLLTDDGEFLHRIISPRSHVTKRYHVTLKNPFNGDEEKAFTSGTMLLEGETKPLLPVGLERLSTHSAYVTLSEGRYHQIRRMFEAMDNEVVTLHRDRIGGLFLPDDLSAGHYRLLNESEIKKITATAP